MTEVILHLGSNQGHRLQNLDLAQVLINQNIGLVIKQSKIYETDAWGNTAQASFLNKALTVSSLLNPEELLHQIHIIESKLGRTRQEKWGPRTIDLDIIFYGEQIIENPNLKIPHSHLTNRNFVLIPLMDICPNYNHPILNQTIKEILESCTDTGVVKQFLN